jgi:hypothetical protein
MIERIVLILGLGLALVACAKKPEVEPVLMTPNSRLIYHDQNGNAVWTWCDRGARVYQTHGGNFQVVPNGCPNGEP